MQYVRNQIQETQTVAKWDQFWAYFVRVWVDGKTGISFDTWNMVVARKQLSEVLIRTNNALERFNREFNKKFPVANPTLLVFVETIREISNRYVRLIAEIRAGKANSPDRTIPKFPEIPEDMKKFINKSKKQRKKK
eukprot:Lithocolla_globosa_v1_NODE_4051_length_1520_cov_228.951536.p2 type:complete len:136 gc:universal NODE_4051_length_1520_cov_228.951536:1093-1500(+)